MKTITACLFLLALVAGATEQKSAPFAKALGVSTAPIKIEVFSDFQCPSCKVLYEGALQPLINDYVATGKVYLVHRDFPLPMHAHAREAAAYAIASSRINKYELVTAALFRQQSIWAANGKVQEAVAAVLNISEMKKVQALINDPTVAAEMEQDIALGKQANVRQTPTMIITRKGIAYPVSGSVTYNILRRFLDDLLNK